ncbi:MAG: helix-turn-helix transcriptional regulator [Desulfobacteraceae bacterium]|nr:MAG: helix-turn-helix transcriptional regulator [Desulfobacteraceae bacterium]
MKNKDEFARRIGNGIKELRKEAGLTLKQLAKATGLSAPLISKIENGLAMPSIPTLRDIADALKVNTGYFFRDEQETGYVISPQGSRTVVVSERGPARKISYELELLAEGMVNPFMEPAIVTLMGKDQDKEIELATHEGQESMYVIEGRMELTLGEKRYTLKKGDAAYWNGSVPHKGISLSKKPAKTLNVHLVPGKRTGTFITRD